MPAGPLSEGALGRACIIQEPVCRGVGMSRVKKLEEDRRGRKKERRRGLERKRGSGIHYPVSPSPRLQGNISICHLLTSTSRGSK